MTPQQQDHIVRLIREFGNAAYECYEAGCEERDQEGAGDLWGLTDEALVDHLMTEVLSLWMYAAALREKFKQAAASQDEKRKEGHAS